MANAPRESQNETEVRRISALDRFFEVVQRGLSGLVTVALLDPIVRTRSSSSAMTSRDAQTGRESRRH